MTGNPGQEEGQLLQVADWLRVYRGGARPEALLAACLERARSKSPPATWIYLATDADLRGQLDALQALADGLSGIDAILQRLPLFGVPFAVKDNIDIAGVHTTAACPAYARIADGTSACVRRLQAAGAVWIGKTNLDQFATGLVGTRSPYGQPSSALDATRISGGSSSGSAVAVAAGLVAFSLGTDTAGSGRIPAGFNQLVGLKPTPGRVGTSGVVPACRSIDCVSVFAMTVDDAAHVLSVIEGADDADSYSRFKPGPADWQGDFQKGLGALRIGYPQDLQLDKDGDYSAPYRAALAHARAAGHELVAVDFTPLHQVADLLYAGPWVAERYSVVRTLLESQPESIDPAVREVIGAATRFSASDAFAGQCVLKALARDAQAIWRSVDVLLVPTAPRHPTFAEVAQDPLGANSALGVYTNFVNLLGWCALALPSGTTASGLPFGVTLIADANHDVALVNLGHTWQASLHIPMGASGVYPAQGVTDVALRSPAVQACLPLAVVGAHLSGMPLNGQLRERGALLRQKTATAPRYNLYALPATTPPKPGLVRASAGGHAIDLEVWDMPLEAVGSFLALIPPPLGLGSVELADGRWVHGFICESHAVAQAADVSSFGGWRAYIQSLASSRPLQPSAATDVHR